MYLLQVALHLLPVLHVLYEAGVIDVSPSLDGDRDIIQVKEDVFKVWFPGKAPDADGMYRYNYNGIIITAVAHD